jgi:hypothetical protein
VQCKLPENTANCDLQISPIYIRNWFQGVGWEAKLIRGILTTALVVIVTLFGVVYIFGVMRSEYMIKANVQSGVSLAHPARKAAREACAQSVLKDNLTNADLGLKPPLSITNKEVQSVTVSSDGPASVLLTIIYNEIEQEIPDSGPRNQTIGVAVPKGASVVYQGDCRERTMTWSISGTVPEKFWPKL